MSEPRSTAFLAFDQTYYVKEISAPPSGKWGLSGKIYSVKFSEKDLPATIQKDADQFVGKDLTVTEDEPSNVKVRVNKTSSLSRADFDWLKAGDREEFVRVRRNTEGGLDIYHTQNSQVLSSCAWADGLVDIPSGAVIHRGDVVHYYPFAQFFA